LRAFGAGTAGAAGTPSMRAIKLVNRPRILVTATTMGLRGQFKPEDALSEPGYGIDF